MTRFGSVCLVAIILALGAGCKKSASPEVSDTPQTKDNPAPVVKSQPETVARVHWTGLRHVAAETNAVLLKPVLELPETKRWIGQTLDKLVLGLLAPEQMPMPGFNAPFTNYQALLRTNLAASLLRPLLDDVVQEESLLEIRAAANAPGELAVAVRLSADRASLWQSNLAAALQIVTGTQATPGEGGKAGWALTLKGAGARSANRLELTRSGDWTLLGLGSAQNALLADFAQRIQRDHAPLAQVVTNLWIEADFDPTRVSQAMNWGWQLPPNTPSLTLAVNGDVSNVVSRATLKFPRQLPFEIEKWNIPTNLIFGPLFSFTAAQGFGPWLSSLSAWKNLNAGPAPNQLFCWSQTASPMLDYGAMPLGGASNVVNKISDELIRIGNPVITSNHMGQLERATNFNGLVWAKVPVAEPFLQSTNLEGVSFIFGGLAPNNLTNNSQRPETLNELAARTNLVYLDRELTGARVEAWMHISQLSRILFRRLQLPLESAAVGWYKAAAPSLGPASTSITRSGPAELKFERSSTMGLTGAELTALGDWLESPRFPHGLHTTLLKLRPFPARLGTNAPPQTH